MKLEYYLKINYIQLTLAFEVLDLFSRGFPDFIAKRARLAPAAARGAFIPLQYRTVNTRVARARWWLESPDLRSKVRNGL